MHVNDDENFKKKRKNYRSMRTNIRKKNKIGQKIKKKKIKKMKIINRQRAINIAEKTMRAGKIE